MFPDLTGFQLRRRLRRVLGARPQSLDRRAARARRDALEQRLLAEHGRRYPSAAGSSASASPSPWSLGAFTGVVQVALVSLMLTLGFAAACQLPTDVEVVLGRRITFEVAADEAAEGRIEALAQAIERRTEAERIELRVRQIVDPKGASSLVASVDLWGSALDLGALEAVLAEHGIAAGEAEDLALAGKVRTTLGDRLGHEWFDLDLDLDAMDVDEARQAILARLEAQGFAGEAEVEIEDNEGGRRVEIRLREADTSGHTPEPAP